MTAMPAERLHHLDALRSFAILYGVLVHAATLGVPWPFGWIAEVSGFFRMAAFFLVSGTLSAMLLERLGTGPFLRRRALALLVPLAFGLVALNPLTNWLIYAWHNGPIGPGPFLEGLAWGFEGARGPMVWHLHLWFLISLMAYALLTPAAVALGRRWGLARLGDALAARPPWLAVLVLALGVGVVGVGLRVAYEATLDPVLARMPQSRLYLWLLRITLYYAPFFALGLGLFHHRHLLARVEAGASWPALALGAALVALASRLDLGGPAGEALRLGARLVLTTATVAALLALFRRWFSAPGRLSGLSDAIYTVYVLHFLVIYLLAHALAPLGLPQGWLFALVVALAVPLLLAAHRLVVAPSPLLSLLLNGKPPPGRRAAAALGDRPR